MGAAVSGKGHMTQTFDKSEPDGWPQDEPLRFAQERVFVKQGRAKRGAEAEHCSCCNRAELRAWVELRANRSSMYHYKYCVQCIDALAKSARSLPRKVK